MAVFRTNSEIWRRQECGRFASFVMPRGVAYHGAHVDFARHHKTPAAGKGAQLALPVVEPRDKTLSFAEWRQGEQLAAGPFGILQPRPSALDVEPDIILVPLVGFDRSGHRIGYGVGYYDRALKSLRAKRPVIAVGIAFAIQEIDAIVAGEHDERLDLVLTEREVIDPRA
jgi:5-formyltetrahydrofolate cyclo-ligase